MHNGSVPIFFINPAFVIVEIQLVRAKYNRKVLWLPLFFMRILVPRLHIPHDAAATGSVPVMRCGENMRAKSTSLSKILQVLKLKLQKRG